MLPPFLRDVGPVKAGEFCFAMDLGEAAVEGRVPVSVNRKQYPYIVATTAMHDYIKDRQQLKSLLLRTGAYSDMLGDPRTAEWRHGDNGEQIHGAFIMAAAEMPINSHGSFDKDDFFNLVKEIAARHPLDEIGKALKEGYQELRDSCFQHLRTPQPQIAEPYYDDDLPVQQRIGVERIGRNQPCPCGSGKKYKKCHGKN